MSVTAMFSKLRNIKPNMLYFIINAKYSSVNRPPDHVRKPSSFDQRILVWSGRYKKIEDIPKEISESTMDKARSKVRIKFANLCMGFTLLLAIFAAYYGKKRAERGESITQMNLDWHEENRKKE